MYLKLFFEGIAYYIHFYIYKIHVEGTKDVHLMVLHQDNVDIQCRLHGMYGTDHKSRFSYSILWRINVVNIIYDRFIKHGIPS